MNNFTYNKDNSISIESYFRVYDFIAKYFAISFVIRIPDHGPEYVTYNPTSFRIIWKIHKNRYKIFNTLAINLLGKFQHFPTVPALGRSQTLSE